MDTLGLYSGIDNCSYPTGLLASRTERYKKKKNKVETHNAGHTANASYGK